MRSHYGQGTMPLSPDQCGGEVDGVERSERHRQRFAGPAEHRRAQQHEVNSLEPPDDGA